MKKYGRIRIIGGRWKRRKLAFPSLPGLRPSPDSVRETLFNWLAPHITGASCLDLFAGSGAFGFEAASRGAAFVQLVESHSLTVKYLGDSIALLDHQGVLKLHAGDAIRYLEQPGEEFDLVFLDPPFEQGLLAPCCDLLANGSRLAASAIIYIESPKANSLLPIPPSWNIIRETTTGMVKSTLIQT
jgi:16S rRNA (guanine966-N2)-methyltransferase